jgi:NAD(P)-dependent dehydrogenase (short-subunit alcohol dehydrogenase family)
MMTIQPKAKYSFPVDAQEFAGKRVLVTGGTKGLGEAMVRRFMLSGARVAVTARSVPAGSDAATLFVQADVSAADGARAVVDRVQREWGGVDILIDNVGGSDSLPGGFETLSDAFWETVLDTNLMSAVRLDRALIPGMMERKFGVVIHIGTMWHRLPQPDSALAYSTAKGALSSYSKGLAKAVAPQGVRVNMVSPGFIETEAARAWMAQMIAAQGISEDAARQRIIDRSGGIPLGRPGTADEVAELVAFLSSDRGAFISGVDYFIDGGAFPAV